MDLTRKLCDTEMIDKNQSIAWFACEASWGRKDMLSSMNGKYGGVSVKYASLIVSCHWIKVFITL